MYFEDIGFRYLGPINGHDLGKLEDIFQIAKEQEGPILIHVLTKKGKVISQQKIIQMCFTALPNLIN